MPRIFADVDSELLAAINRARGATPRAVWLRTAAIERLTRDELRRELDELRAAHERLSARLAEVERIAGIRPPESP